MTAGSHTFGDDKLGVRLSARDGALTLAVTDLQGGKLWNEVPLLTLDIHDKMQRRTDVVQRFEIRDLQVAANSAHVFVVDSFRRVSAGLWLKVIDGELSVSLPLSEVYEDNAAHYRLFALNLLPGLMQTGKGGHLLLPITSGYLCDPSQKPKTSERFLIYGEQPRWELLPTLPFCAASSSDGGLMALAIRGACDTECRVATDGAGGGEIGFAFSLRREWIDPVDFETREIRYIPLPRDEKAYLAVSRRLRRHIIEDLGKRTLTQRIEDWPALGSVLRSYVMKMFHASPHDSGLFTQIMKPHAETEAGPLDIWTTFAEGRECMRKLHTAGLDHITFECVGWIPRGHDGMFPTRLPPEERLGGESGLRELIAFGQSLGYCVSLHDNYGDVFRVSPDWNTNTVIHDYYGEPLITGLWGGGTSYRQWPLAMPDSRLIDQMKKVQEFGIRDFYYVDALGNPLEVNYHPDHKGPRSGHAKGIARILQTAKEVFGSVGTECGFLYAAQHADIMVMNGWGWNLKNLKPEWGISHLCDRQLPIWQLSLHGLIALEGHGHGWHDVMQKILFGNLPRTEWCARPGMFPMLDDSLVAALKADYDLTTGQFGHLLTLTMTDYQEQDGVASTKFEDGTEIVADYNNSTLHANGKIVEIPPALHLPIAPQSR